jgi:hypothetical protein
MRASAFEKDEPLEVGALYVINGDHLINVYDTNDPTARWYEKFQVRGPAYFIVVSNHMGMCIEEEKALKIQQSTSLVLSTHGVGRFPIGAKDYNNWRYKKIETE